jgi:rubredoxin
MENDLLQKIIQDTPGSPLPPEHPPLWPPDPKCDKCSGTGWKWSERYETFFLCPCCTTEKKQYIPRLPYSET